MYRSAATDYRRRIATVLADLGADFALVERRRLPVIPEARRMNFVGLGTDGRDKFLTAGTAHAWERMRDAAELEGVPLLLVSAFRSFEYQHALIRAKLARGRSIDEILRVNAPPGCSEHHSGRAIDIGCVGTPPLEEDFENTSAFSWLTRHAGQFGFRLSYPRNNRHGYLYEPWHWYWQGRAATD